MIELFGTERSLDVQTNVNKVDFRRCDKLAAELPLSKEVRPTWDIAVLTTLGFDDIGILMTDMEDFTYDTPYGKFHTPVNFGLCARLPYPAVTLSISKKQDEVEAIKEMVDDGVVAITETWKVLSNKDCVKLLLTLYEVNVTASQAAELLGCSYSLAAHDLKLLVDTGLVTSERVNGEKVYTLKERQAVRDLYNITKEVRYDRNTGFSP